VNEEPAATLRRLVNGYQVTQALHVAATLDIADLLADGPRSSDDLAAATETHAPSLYRLLRALAAVGVLREDGERGFELTPVGNALKSDALQGWAAFVGRPYHWQAWTALLHSIRTGEDAFTHVHGSDPWSYRADRPEEGAIFDRAMTSLTAQTTRAVLDAYDFGRFGTVVDVGGGRGALLAGLLGRYPKLRAVLFDQPHVVEGVDLGERGEIVAGSFFDAVSAGGDAYVLKSIIHDWEDADAATILRNCRHDDAVVLVIERIVPAPNEGADTKFSDLNMMVATGGRERTLEEFESLFEAAGLGLVAATPTASGFHVIEAAGR
jgi:hypothetical protein